jgi:putative nucleotidyltransferase with HDIG domain
MASPTSSLSHEAQFILSQIDKLPLLPPIVVGADEAVRSATIAKDVIQLFGMMPVYNESGEVARSGIWKHALAVACAAKRIAGMSGQAASQNKSFAQGLLHDVGKLALVTLMPRGYTKVIREAEKNQVDIAEVERDLLGVDHLITGHRLAKRWNLPPDITDAISLHHGDFDSLSIGVRIVRAADLLAREQAIGCSGNPCPRQTSLEMAETLGLSNAQWVQVRESLQRDVAANASWISEQRHAGPRDYAEAIRKSADDSIIAIAAGAAHELNNPLAVISGRAQMLDASITDEEAKRSLCLIREHAEAASDIVSQLMDFAAPPAPAPEVVDVVRIVHELRQDLIDSGLLEEPQITIESEPDGQVAYFDPSQLLSTLRAILDNAIDATQPSTRMLTVKIALDVSEEKLVVQVADNGHGMAPDVMARALDPFFSHRPAGRKRGLGLARVGQWLRQGGGSIRFESTLDKGTCVELCLPVRRSVP